MKYPCIGYHVLQRNAVTEYTADAKRRRPRGLRRCGYMVVARARSADPVLRRSYERSTLCAAYSRRLSAPPQPKTHGTAIRDFDRYLLCNGLDACKRDTDVRSSKHSLEQLFF